MGVSKKVQLSKILMTRLSCAVTSLVPVSIANLPPPSEPDQAKTDKAADRGRVQRGIPQTGHFDRREKKEEKQM